MKSLEIEGKTIDEAIEKACNEFQVSREKLNIEIISEGTSGFLGIVGNKKAKITATLLSLDEALADSLETASRADSPKVSAGNVFPASSHEEGSNGTIADRA